MQGDKGSISLELDGVYPKVETGTRTSFSPMHNDVQSPPSPLCGVRHEDERNIELLLSNWAEAAIAHQQKHLDRIKSACKVSSTIEVCSECRRSVLDVIYEHRKSGLKIDKFPDSCYGLALHNIMRIWLLGPKVMGPPEILSNEANEAPTKTENDHKYSQDVMTDNKYKDVFGDIIINKDKVKVKPGQDKVGQENQDPRKTIEVLSYCSYGLLILLVLGLLTAYAGFFICYALISLPIMLLFLDRYEAIKFFTIVSSSASASASASASPPPPTEASDDFTKLPKKFVNALKFGKVVVDTHFPAIVSFIVQGGALLLLWRSLPAYRNHEFCAQGQFLEFALLSVFYATLASSLGDIHIEIKLISAPRVVILLKSVENIEDLDANDKVVIAKVKFSHAIYFRLLAVVLMEFTIWCAVAIVGTKFLLTAEGPSGMVQAAVAINYLNDVDNFFFAAFIPESYRKGMLRIRYEHSVSQGMFDYLSSSNSKSEYSPKNIFNRKNLNVNDVISFVSAIIKGFGGPFVVVIPIVIAVLSLRAKYC